jgi:hypothetical protein
LTGVATAPEELAGSGPSRAASPDPITTRVLVRGEAVPGAAGRADDFAWPRPDTDVDAIIPVVSAPTATPAVQRPAAAAKKAAPPPAEQRKAAPRRPGQSAASAPPASAAPPSLFAPFGGPSPARPPR